jgi:hypothetical protein
MDGFPERRPVNKAIQEFLQNNTSFPVGVGEAPMLSAAHGNQEGVAHEPPYVILEPIRGGSYFGPRFHKPEADASFRYNVVSVGYREDQAELVSERVQRAMVGRDEDGRLLYTLIIPGMSVMDRRFEQSPGPSDRKGRIHYVVDTFIVSVTTS